MSQLGRFVSDSTVTMTQLVLPTHTNSLDSVFGGIMMSWIDIAAAVAAQRHSASDVVTASIDSLNFVKPVYKGWVVNLKASVNFVGKTSMEVGVRVDAENPRTGEKFHTASAYLTFVALDQFGKPKQAPPLICQTPEDERRFNDAKLRRSERLKFRKK